MRLRDCLCDNDLNESLQSAYKKHHSCETALLLVQNDILKSIDNEQYVVLLLLDQSAAFDTVDHSGAPARASRARSGAPWVRKFGKLSISENLVMT